MTRKPRAKRKSAGSRLARAAAPLLAAALVGAGAYGWWLMQPPSASGGRVRVAIPAGTSAHAAAAILKEDGIVRSAPLFALYLRLERARLRAGVFELSRDMRYGEIRQELALGGTSRGGRERFTVPEGWTLAQIADALDSRRICSGREFTRLATSADVIENLHTDFPLPSTTLEGYLFPDTYAFAPGTPPLEVIETMLANFSMRFPHRFGRDIEASGRSLRATVILASIIEREARVPQDRAKIAGVIVNRLARGMKLEVDATVLYALGHHKDTVTFADLNVRSPYNTYRHPGLPPGPISNPGIACLEAAVHPERSDYLYYVAGAGGAHVFSRTPEEHAAAIRLTRGARAAAGHHAGE